MDELLGLKWLEQWICSHRLEAGAPKEGIQLSYSLQSFWLSTWYIWCVTFSQPYVFLLWMIVFHSKGEVVNRTQMVPALFFKLLSQAKDYLFSDINFKFQLSVLLIANTQEMFLIICLKGHSHKIHKNNLFFHIVFSKKFSFMNLQRLPTTFLFNYEELQRKDFISVFRFYFCWYHWQMMIIIPVLSKFWMLGIDMIKCA